MSRRLTPHDVAALLQLVLITVALLLIAGAVMCGCASFDLKCFVTMCAPQPPCGEPNDGGQQQ